MGYQGVWVCIERVSTVLPGVCRPFDNLQLLVLENISLAIIDKQH
jgi:hypothetical protein